MNANINNLIELLPSHPKMHGSILSILQELLRTISMNHAMIILAEDNFYRVLLHQTDSGAINLAGDVFERRGKNKICTSPTMIDGKDGPFHEILHDKRLTSDGKNYNEWKFAPYFAVPLPLNETSDNISLILFQPNPSAFSLSTYFHMLPYFASVLGHALSVSLRFIRINEDLTSTYSHIGSLNLKVRKLEKLYQIIGDTNYTNREETAENLLDAAITIANAKIGYLLALRYPGPKIFHKWALGAHAGQIFNDLPIKKLLRWTQSKKNNILEIKTKTAFWKCVKSDSESNNVGALLMCSDADIHSVSAYSLKAIVEQAQHLFVNI